MTRSGKKRRRQNELVKAIDANPFVTDEELSKIFNVSVQTIRLDRLELGIPEVRERIKNVAEDMRAKVRTIQGTEVIGDLVELKLNERALSILHTDSDMGLRRSGIVRGHIIFALANSLAIATVDAETALTGSATIRFIRPVKVGERLIAKSNLLSIEGKKYIVQVAVRVGEEEVSKGEFVIISVDR